MARVIRARAPSNIALVKYMGKSDSTLNLPENPSLSMTLSGLCTDVELCSRSGESIWGGGVSLSEAGQERIIRHLNRTLRRAPEILAPSNVEPIRESMAFELKSTNNFPASAGIASSASSFAAVTLAGLAASAGDLESFARAWESEPTLRRAAAALSREGSGSSCRSMEGPWVTWDRAEARAVPSKLGGMAHFVVMISSDSKEVSSSQAHEKVKSSPLWQGRAERASARHTELLSALECGDLRAISRIAWVEAWEMHSLFHTSSEPFSYWKPGTLEALDYLRKHLADPTPPIVTLDAGPNVHVSVPERLRAQWRERLGRWTLLEDGAGKGAILF